MRILSLSGGGAQGIYTAHLLARMERPSAPIGEQVELISGTSIGSALAACLAWGMEGQEIVSFFEKSVGQVFPNPRPDRFRSFLKASRNVSRPRYATLPWRALLKELFGDMAYGDSPIPLIIPAINAKTGELRRFCSWKSPDKNFKVVDIILASSAAPVFFPIHKMEDGEMYIDGGLFSNAPDLVALTHAQVDFKKSIEDIEMVSLGSGLTDPKIFVRPSSLQWGLRDWVMKNRLCSLAMSVSQNGPVCLTRDLLQDRFVRIDINPTPAQRSFMGIDRSDAPALAVFKEMAYQTDLSKLPSWLKSSS